jgi:anti-anti-sigma factor
VSDASDQSGLVTVQVDRLPDRTVAALVGELDMSNATDVLHRLTEAAVGADRLEVDLSRLQFIDSAGIAALDRLHRVLADGPPDRLTVTAGPQTVAGRTLRLAGMDQVLPMTPEAAAPDA